MKSENIMIRVSAIEKAAWDKEAKNRGMTLSEFIRFVINAKIERYSGE